MWSDDCSCRVLLGFNGWGQLGDGSTANRATPTLVQSAQSFLTVAAGGTATCAVTSLGEIHCWGDNSWGQLGDGTLQNSQLPRRIPSSASFVSVTAGTYHFCALANDGQAYCWGMNIHGQLGLGYESFSVTRPQQVVGGHRFVSLSAAGFSTSWNTGATCGVRGDGAVLCWGSNSAGQLGNGHGWALTPVPVHRVP